MRATTRLWMLTLVLLAAGTALAQPREGRGPGRGGEEIFLFNDRIIDLMIDRISDDLGKQYKFDEEQLLNTRDSLKSRFPQWLKDNRAELIALANQWTETMFAADPPTAEEMAAWSQRALPLLRQFDELVKETTEEMRTYMTDEQQTQLDGELAAYGMAMGYMHKRLGDWSAGNYDWETEWPRSEAFRQNQRNRDRELQQKMNEARRQAVGADAATPPPAAGGAETPDAKPDTPRPAAAPAKTENKDDYEAYTTNFIKRYKLDEAQQGQAWKICHALQETRDKYLSKSLAKINDLHERLAKVQTDEDREKISAEYRRLTQPLDRYFNQLKDKLDKIPTGKQRAEAARATMSAELKPKGKPAAAESAPAKGQDKP